MKKNEKLTKPRLTLAGKRPMLEIYRRETEGTKWRTKYK